MVAMFVLLICWVLVPLAILAAVRLLGGPAPGVPSRPGFVGWLAQSTAWQVVIAVGLSLLIFVSSVDHHGQGLLLALVVTALVLLAIMLQAWRHEVHFLMSLRDEDFPGHDDKLVWAAFLILMPPVGLWLFRSYRQAHWPEPEAIGKAAPVSDWI